MESLDFDTITHTGFAASIAVFLLINTVKVQNQKLDVIAKTLKEVSSALTEQNKIVEVLMRKGNE